MRLRWGAMGRALVPIFRVGSNKDSGNIADIGFLMAALTILTVSP